jgi:hypothetical protein
MEKPTIDPATGEPLWQPNGARQRFAKRMAEEIDFDRMFVVAAYVVPHRMVERGEIGPEDGVDVSMDQVINVIEWADLRQLRLLRKWAESLDEPEKMSIN